MKAIKIKNGMKFIFEDAEWMVDSFKRISKNKDGDTVRYYKCYKTSGSNDVRNFEKNNILNGLI